MVLLRGRYRQAKQSQAFAGLRMADLERFLRMIPSTRENDVIRSLGDWVRAHYRPQ